jgi:hypothetical protein
MIPERLEKMLPMKSMMKKVAPVILMTQMLATPRHESVSKSVLIRRLKDMAAAWIGGY